MAKCSRREDYISLFFSDGETLWSQTDTPQGDALSNLTHAVFDKYLVDPFT